MQLSADAIYLLAAGFISGSFVTIILLMILEIIRKVREKDDRN